MKQSLGGNRVQNVSATWLTRGEKGRMQKGRLLGSIKENTWARNNKCRSPETGPSATKKNRENPARRGVIILRVKERPEGLGNTKSWRKKRKPKGKRYPVLVNREVLGGGRHRKKQRPGPLGQACKGEGSTKKKSRGGRPRREKGGAYHEAARGTIISLKTGGETRGA